MGDLDSSKNINEIPKDYNPPTKIIKEKTSHNILEAAFQMCKRSKACFMITSRESGVLGARMMYPKPFEQNGDGKFEIIFSTRNDNRKLKELKADPRITLAWRDTDKGGFDGYCTMACTARILETREEILKAYDKMFDCFYSNGIDSPELAMLVVEPFRIEVAKQSVGFGTNKAIPETLQLNKANNVFEIVPTMGEE